MTVSIYNASWSTFGGGEKYSCAIADVLSRGGHRVEILVERPEITVDTLRSYFNLRLQNVDVHICDRSGAAQRLARSELACIVSNFRPFGCPGRRTLYVLQIPYPPITLTTLGKRIIAGEVKEAAKDLLRLRLLDDSRRASGVVVYSEFVRECLERNHRVHATVLYPPIDDFESGGAKGRAILSVGRIFRGPYNDKRYDVMIDAFRRFCRRFPGESWEYWIAGSCGEDPASRKYLDTLRADAEGIPVRFFVNAPYTQLRMLYDRAMIFWHAAGYGVDEVRDPHRTEHFGMSTVEAMSAGCIPVVMNNGGQREIVTHGVNGFLWNTVEDFVSLTGTLCANPAALATFREQARLRYFQFDRAHFAERLHSIVTTIETGQ